MSTMFINYCDFLVAIQADVLLPSMQLFYCVFPTFHALQPDVEALIVLIKLQETLQRAGSLVDLTD